MIWILNALAQTAPPPVVTVEKEPVVEMHHQHVLFNVIPDKKVRKRVIRKAFKTSEVLHGGQDWGRALCFVFVGPPEPDALERALKKARVTGLVRDAEDCRTPPPEAYIPAEPIAYRRVRFTEAVEPMDMRTALTFLFERDVGVSGVHVAPERSNTACLELERKRIDDVALKAALGDSPLILAELAKVDDCSQAFATP